MRAATTIRRALAAAVLFLPLPMRGAVAQLTSSHAYTLTAPPTLYLNVTTPTVTFAAPAASDFTTGYRNATSSTSIAYAGNTRMSVVIWTAATNFTASGGTSLTDPANASLPVGNILWSTNNYTTTTAVVGGSTSTTGGRVVNKAAAGDYRTTPVTVVFRMLLSYPFDTPATYAFNFNYTIIAE